MKSIDKELVSNFSSEQHRLIVNILYTAEWLNTEMSVIVKDKGITTVQYNILRILLGSYPNTLSVGDVKKRSINKKADVTRILDRLVEKDLVTRELCPENRRRMDVKISKKGILMMEELSPLIKVKMDNYHEKNIKIKDAKNFNQILDQIRNR